MAPTQKRENPDSAERPATDPTAVVDAVMDHVALEHAESAEVFTLDEDRWAQGVRQRVDRELAALRRQITPSQSRHKHSPTIPEEFLALDREALIERLSGLRNASGVLYAHEDLTGVTCDDLRQMIAAILGPSTEE